MGMSVNEDQFRSNISYLRSSVKLLAEITKDKNIEAVLEQMISMVCYPAGDKLTDLDVKKALKISAVTSEWPIFNMHNGETARFYQLPDDHLLRFYKVAWLHGKNSASKT